MAPSLSQNSHVHSNAATVVTRGPGVIVGPQSPLGAPGARAMNRGATMPFHSA